MKRPFGRSSAIRSGSRPGILALYRSTFLYLRLYLPSLAAATGLVLVPFLLAEMLFSVMPLRDVMLQLQQVQDANAAMNVLRSSWHVFLAWGIWVLVQAFLVDPLLKGTIGRICRNVWRHGRPASIGEAFPGALRRLGVAILVLVLQIILLSAAGAIVGGVMALVAGELPHIGAPTALTITVTIVIGIVGAVAWCWLSLRLSQTLMVAVMERGGPFRALARSWRLTRGAALYVLGFLILSTVTAAAIQWVCAAVGSVAPDSWWSALLAAVGALLSAPYLAVARAQLYLSLSDEVSE